MAVFTDSPEFAAVVLPEHIDRRFDPPTDLDPRIRTILGAFLHESRGIVEAPEGAGPWAHLLLTEFALRSNYDQFVRLAREGVRLPDRLACLAGAGHGFRGFKGRAWAAVPGNIHLSVHLAPGRPIERFEVAFTVLAALSVLDAVDRVPGLSGRAGLKWVNDVVVGEAKIGGVLAYTQTQGTVVSSAVLGMGVNVQTRPAVEPTPFVPAVSCLREHAADPDADLRRAFFGDLLDALDRNYRILLSEGHGALVERYRARSVVLGREVAVCPEDSDRNPCVHARGTVRAMGDGLELHLEGRPEPVTRGRLILEARTAHAFAGGRGPQDSPFAPHSGRRPPAEPRTPRRPGDLHRRTT